ncbi:hypothetical protein ACWFRJ_11980 [Streptomyces sp. NPDC055239]
MRDSLFSAARLFAAPLLKELAMTLGTVPGLVLGDASRTSTREPLHLA